MEVLHKLYRDGMPSAPVLFGEGAAMALMGTLFGWWLFPSEVSLVAVFFATMATTDSIARVLEGNRKAIYSGTSPRRANAHLARSVFSLFMGGVVGFSLLGLTLPIEHATAVFESQLGDYNVSSLADLHFGQATALLANNLYVLLFFFVVALPLRHGGVMFAVMWNASVWGATFALIARRWADGGGPGRLEGFFRVTAACAPHMALEALSYTLAGFAGVFLSLGLARHSLGSPVMLEILRSVLVMLLLSLALVVAGAVWEASIATWLVSTLS